MEQLTPKQLRVVKFIRNFTDKRGYSPTLDEIAGHMRVTKPTVQQYIRALEDKDVIHRQRYAHRSIELVEEDAASGQLPLYGRIAAGQPLQAIETDEAVDINELLGAEKKNMFLLQVDGNSMIDDGIFDGDYVVVERNDTAENGDTVVALLPDGTATLKQLYREKTRIRLQPANSKLKPIYVTDVSIQGVVRGVVRPL